MLSRCSSPGLKLNLTGIGVLAGAGSVPPVVPDAAGAGTLRVAPESVPTVVPGMGAGAGAGTVAGAAGARLEVAGAPVAWAGAITGTTLSAAKPVARGGTAGRATGAARADGGCGASGGRTGPGRLMTAGGTGAGGRLYGNVGATSVAGR